jgi:hypothetical protein
VEEYGYASWELDALPPDALTALIQKAVRAFRDEVRWDAQLKREANHLDLLDQFIEELG